MFFKERIYVLSFKQISKLIKLVNETDDPSQADVFHLAANFTYNKCCDLCIKNGK